MTKPDRILATHAGSLPRSESLRTLIFDRAAKKPYDAAQLATELRQGVAEVVRKQVAAGMDYVNDGEIGKTNFTNYCRERIGGFESRTFAPGEGTPPHSISARDEIRFGAYFESGRGNTIGNSSRMQAFCVEPLRYVGHDALHEDIANLKAATAGVDVAGAYMNANTPGTIEHWLFNEQYKDEEEFIYAIGEVMREEYLAIHRAGFLLQIDDPDLPDAWQMYPSMTVAEYRRYAQMRVEALNYALRDIPKEDVQLHVCWGSFHGPHQNDIPLRDIIDIILSVNASRFSIEAANPVHEHEWRVFEDVKLPEGAVLIPGVVGHATNFIEHPELVADRLERYARLVGKENVIAGTDCGIGPRVGHPEIAWAKLESIAAGARVATARLWN
jgi:5-methyltetrahydropteroyltriglutamate--homocysteine methyltransferase